MKMTKLSALVACAMMSLAVAACGNNGGASGGGGGTPPITETVDCEGPDNGTGTFNPGNTHIVRRDAAGNELSRRALGPNEACP